MVDDAGGMPPKPGIPNGHMVEAAVAACGADDAARTSAKLAEHDGAVSICERGATEIPRLPAKVASPGG
jgi:hypothetical protein